MIEKKINILKQIQMLMLMILVKFKKKEVFLNLKQMNNLIHIKKNLNNYNNKKKPFYFRKLLKNQKKFKKKDNKELKNKNQKLHNLQNLEYL